MSYYKDILLLADPEVGGLILDNVSIAGVRLTAAADSTDFLLKLDANPDGIIVSAGVADEFLLSALANTAADTPAAAVVEISDHNSISKFMTHGVTTFIPSENLCKGLCSFIERILVSGDKDKVIFKALRRMRNLVGNVNEGVIILDEQSRVGYSNTAAEKLLDMDKKEILRKELSEFLVTHPYPINEFAEQPVYIDNYKLETAKGHKVSVNSTYSANIEKGVFAGAVILLSEVSSYYMDKQKELELLKYQERYHSAQQNTAFKKQMLVMKDEVSNLVAGQYRIETYFKPLDILSGDIYGSINIKDGRYLFYVIDAMGKGLSASVTALQSTSFINHSLELSILKLDFDLNRTISSFLHYIRDRLMDEEALCVVFALLDTNEDTLTVANYGMPPIQLMNADGSIDTIRPNNLPIMRCISDKNIETYNLRNVDKIMIMSDGMTETVTSDDNLYMDYLKDDFAEALTKKHMLSLMSKRVSANNDDDITFFFISKYGLDRKPDVEIAIDTDINKIMEVSSGLTERMIEDGMTMGDIGTVEYALSEILMNALEHGNLGLGYDEKQMLISKGIYDDFLMQNTAPDSPNRNKKIKVGYSFAKFGNNKMVVISVTDEGKGFTPANLFKYHSFDGNLCHIDKTSYNGRGIFITDTLIDGLYYNENGNCAYLMKIVEN